MKKYSAYKDSGIEWIGEIPEGWEVKRLKYLCTLIGEKTHEKPEFIVALENIESWTGKIVGDINHSDLEGDVNLFEKGDVLFNKLRPYLAKVIEAPRDGGSVGELLVLRPFDSIVSRFLFYRLISHLIIDLVDGSTYGTKMPRASWDNFISLLPIPTPIEEQEQTTIANYLDHKTTKIDTLIEQKKQLIVLYKEERTATINAAVTGKLDVTKMSGLGLEGLKDGQDSNNPINRANPKNPNADKRKMKDSGIDWIGEIPEDWEVKPLKYLGQIINGYSFKSEDFVDNSSCRVMKISNIQTMTVDWSDDSYLPDDFYKKHPVHQIKNDDLVFALTRPIISSGIKATIVKTEENILLNQRNAVFRPSQPETNSWLYFIVLSSSFIDEFDRLIDKTGQQPNISSNDIANITVPLPPKNEIRSIDLFLEEVISRINTIISKTESEITLLQEYKTTLISEVVLGRVDVREETV